MAPEDTEVELQYSTNFEDLDNPSSTSFKMLLHKCGTGDTEQQIKPVKIYYW